MIKFLWATVLVIFWAPTCLWAQNASITAWLEQKLSVGGSTVQIDGLTGVLTSDIHIDRMTFSDGSGLWAELQNATLSWSRAALLQGRLDINRLSADDITVFRMPQVDTPGMTRTAQPWALPTLPKLPISMIIRSFEIEKFNWLPESESSVIANLNGNLQYDEMGLVTDLNAQVQNGMQETLSLTGQYALETGQITTAARYSENSDGALSRALGLANAGPISVDLDGTGQASNFMLTYGLKTQFAAPLSGQLSMSGNTTGTHVLAKLNGDLSPLIISPVAALKRAGNMAVELDLSILNDKRISVNHLQVASQTLSAQGKAAFDANHWPEQFQLNVTVAPGTLSEDLAQVSGVDTEFGEGQFELSYNRTLGDQWTLNADFQDAGFGAYQATRSGIVGIGKIGVKPAALDDNWINGVISLTATQLSGPQDIQPLINGDITAGFEFNYSAQTGLGLKNITAKSKDVSVTGQLTLPADYAEITANLALDMRELSVIRPLTRMLDLAGSAQAQADITYHFGDGEFSLSSTLQTDMLSGVHPQMDRFLAGKSDLDLALERNSSGTYLRRLALLNPQISMESMGNITLDSSKFTAQATLNDAQLIDPSLSGRLRTQVSAQQATQTSNWDIAGDLRADQNTEVSYSASSHDGKVTNLRVTGNTDAAMVNGFLAPNSIKGPLTFDLVMADIVDRASLSGNISMTNGTLAMNALPAPILGADISAKISNGRATLDGRATYGDQKTGISASGWADLVTLGELDLKAKLDPISMRLQSGIEARLKSNIRFASTPNGGYLTSGQIDLSDLFVDLGQIAVSNSTELSVIHKGISPQYRDFLTRMGLITPSDETTTSRRPIALDIKIAAPNRIFVRGRGVDAEFGGSMQIKGTTTSIKPLGEFNLIRGRMDILTKRVNIAQGRLVLMGSTDPEISLKADISGQDGDTLYIEIMGRVSQPQLLLSSDSGRPSEEVLANVLFGKAMEGLSPTQALLLVNALRTLGSPNPSVLERVRATIGLDDLDIDQNQNGDVAVSAGKYINDNAYIEFKLDSVGTSQTRLNLDLNKRTKGFISHSTTGEGQFGITVGKDYE